MLDLLALLILAAFVTAGFFRGTVATGAALASLLVSYGAAVFLGPVWGDPVAEALDISRMFGVPVAGALAFLASYLVCGVASAVLRRLDRVRRLGASRTLRDRIGGCVFGAARAGLVILLLSILAGWMDAARDAGVMQLESLPEAESSMVVRASGAVLASAATTMLGDEDPGARVAASVLANPSQAVENLQAVVDHDAFRALQGDQLFWTLVEEGATQAAMNQGPFLRMSQDEALRQRMADLGVISDEAAADPATFRRQAGSALEEIGPRIRGLREDPAVAALANDPEVARMIQSGDTVSLLRHPGVREVVTRFASN